MTDSITPPVEPPSFELQMIDYLYALIRQSMPQWVPSAIRITGAIFPGDWPCTTTVFGLIHIAGSGDRTIVINPVDCEILAFRWNAKRETVLREQAKQSDLKSQISNLKSPEVGDADPT